MKITSIIAIYLLFWVMSAFVVLPFGVRTNDELGVDDVAGQERGAPGNFRPRVILLRATILSVVLFALYYANYVNGWVSVDDLDFAPEPPAEIAETG